ncbi:hypothetical protein EZV62_002223 [Acer yangbiense]|uniref:Fatty acyl-CoA reductase n=1 Tax=Acer yangbiense TaxID=1000413 RepID=A0A5C7IXN4_9ROSI|nr:hypothetical protein EZV62_002223 [Acer yangbiense]
MVVCLEKILRIQPNVKKIYLLIRAGDTNSAVQRILNEVIYKYINILVQLTMDGTIVGFGKGKLKCLPAKHDAVIDLVLQLMNWLLCQCCKDICIDYDRKIKFVLRVVELYKPYMCFKGIFDDTNTDKLRMTMRERVIWKWIPLTSTPSA